MLKWIFLWLFPLCLVYDVVVFLPALFRLIGGGVPGLRRWLIHVTSSGFYYVPCPEGTGQGKYCIDVYQLPVDVITAFTIVAVIMIGLNVGSIWALVQHFKRLDSRQVTGSG